MQTTDGGFAAAGWIGSYTADSSDIYFIRTAGNGDSLWAMTYGGSSNDECYSVIQNADGGFALLGWTFSFGFNY